MRAEKTKPRQSVCPSSAFLLQIALLCTWGATTGRGYSLAPALSNQRTVCFPMTGNLPAFECGVSEFRRIGRMLQIQIIRSTFCSRCELQRDQTRRCTAEESELSEVGPSKASSSETWGMNAMKESRTLTLPHPVTAALLPFALFWLSVTGFSDKRQLGHIAIFLSKLNL